MSLKMYNIGTSICLSLSFSLQELTGFVQAVQCDDFQVISGSNDGTLVMHDLELKNFNFVILFSMYSTFLIF